MIIRVKKRETSYVVLDVTSLRDKNLSSSAKGLHAYLMTLPNDWKVRLKELPEHFSDGYSSLRNAFSELEKFKYAIIRRNTDNKGHPDWRVFVYETPTTGDAVHDDELASIANNKKEKIKKSSVDSTFDSVVKCIPEKWEPESTAWASWYTYRKSINRKFTPAAMKLLVKKHGDCSKSQIFDAIDRSIAAGWVGLFPREVEVPQPTFSTAIEEDADTIAFSRSVLFTKYPINAVRTSAALACIRNFWNNMPGSSNDPETAKGYYRTCSNFISTLLSSVMPAHVKNDSKEFESFIVREERRLGLSLRKK